MADFTSLISNAAVNGAYRSTRELKSSQPAQPEVTGEVKPSFADMVSKVGNDAVQTVREAEQVAQAGLTGKAETQQVVEATLELDTTVKVAVSVRDKLVEAYQEIMRMPI